MSKKETVAFMQKVANIMMKGIRKLAEKLDNLDKRVQVLEARIARGGGGTPAPAPQPSAQQYAPQPTAPAQQYTQQPQTPQAAPAPARAPPPRAPPPSETSGAVGPGVEQGPPPPGPKPSGMSLQQEMLQELKSLFGK